MEAKNKKIKQNFKEIIEPRIGSIERFEEIQPYILVGRGVYSTPMGTRVLLKYDGVGNDKLVFQERSVLHVGGWHKTGADGIIEFLISEYVDTNFSPSNATRFFTPKITTATPINNVAILTVQSSVVDTDGDEDIKFVVRSFGANGDVRGNVAFNWQCIVPYDAPDF